MLAEGPLAGTGRRLRDGRFARRSCCLYYRLPGAGVDETVVERVLGFHADGCPVARSIRGAIEVTTSYELA